MPGGGFGHLTSAAWERAYGRECSARAMTWVFGGVGRGRSCCGSGGVIATVGVPEVAGVVTFVSAVWPVTYLAYLRPVRGYAPRARRGAGGPRGPRGHLAAGGVSKVVASRAHGTLVGLAPVAGSALALLWSGVRGAELEIRLTAQRIVLIRGSWTWSGPLRALDAGVTRGVDGTPILRLVQAGRGSTWRLGGTPRRVVEQVLARIREAAGHAVEDEAAPEVPVALQRLVGQARRDPEAR